MMGTCEWNEAIGGLVFYDDGGHIRLCILARPSPEIIDRMVAEYPDLPIRQGIADCWPSSE